MVKLTFKDGSKVITQKALFYAANDLGAFESISSQKEFANWHLNEWGPNVMVDPIYKAAHKKFNIDQIKYNDTLIRANPDIALKRLSFVQEHTPENQSAITAAQSNIVRFNAMEPVKKADKKVAQSLYINPVETGASNATINSIDDPNSGILQNKLSHAPTHATEVRYLLDNNLAALSKNLRTEGITNLSEIEKKDDKN